jgi:hypothetical protein
MQEPPAICGEVIVELASRFGPSRSDRRWVKFFYRRNTCHDEQH